ncbi:MAG: N-acetyltransferase [Sphingobacteriales bacterium]|nr:MAG: N-acetyltransferase [Sphingobacteriales bacterium]
MNLHTEHLSLRTITLADLNIVHDLHSLPETDQYNTLGIPENVETTHNIVNAWLQNQNGPSHTFIIEERDNGAFVGIISLSNSQNKWQRGEIWYKLHKDHWCKGYGTEVVKEIIRFGFENLKMHRIEAGCAVDNLASARVMEKSGMQREGRKRKVLPIRGEWHDGFSYAILEEDYYKSIEIKD